MPSPDKFRVLLVYPNLMLVLQLPSHLPLLAACLKKEGYDVRLFDTTLYRTTDKTVDEIRTERLQVKSASIIESVETEKQDIFEAFTVLVEEYKPDLIGVSVVDDTVKMGLDLIGSLRDRKALTVFGGKYATFNPAGLIERKEVDVVCVGDGEDSVVELCNRLSLERPYDDIAGL